MRKCFALVLLGMSILSCSKEADKRFSLIPPDKSHIDFVNLIEENDTFNILKDEYMYNGGGVGVADFNNDGLPDLVFSGNTVNSRVYLNKGNLEFEDITMSLQGLSNEKWVSGITIVDINSDGYSDIYFTCTSNRNSDLRKNSLWINQGPDAEGIPQFIEQAEKYGIADKGYSVHAAFLDYDLDGDLDLYVLNNTVNKQVPSNYRPKLIDGSSVNNDTFYENNGDGTFSDKTIEAGIVIEGYGLGLAVSDINKDGFPDLYVSNDYIANDLLYINQGDKTFRNTADTHLSYQSKFSMGNNISDINRDGNPDIITLDMLPREYMRKKQTVAGASYMFYVNDQKYGYQHQYVRNMLQVHNGFLDGSMLPFSEVGQFAGIFDTEWSWSPLFGDFDNDGDLDLMVTNGFPKDLTDKDFTNYKAQMYNHLVTDKQVLEQIPEAKVSNFAFEQTGDLQFRDVTDDWGMKIPSYSNGAAYADLDNDGDLDYVVNNIDEPAFLFRNNTAGNEGAGNYLKVKLEGIKPNTHSIGAKVSLWANGTAQYWEQYPVRGYISTMSNVLHFGLGDTKPDSLVVIWPGDKEFTVIPSVPVNQLLTIKQSESENLIYENKNEDGLLFSRTDKIEYRHDQEDYIDFFDNQNVMPHKFSQIGPCLAKGDLNNDGLDDLLIGASDKLPTTVFIRTDAGFEHVTIPGLTENRECTEADLEIMDVDSDGDNDVVAISGGYRNQNTDEYKHFWYENKGGRFEQHPLALPAFPGAVVKPFDFDNDGDTDLFIGSRIKRNFFPFAGPSYILINDNGVLSTSPQLTFDLGMVTDAVWSDIDNDSFQDLAITREWNTVAVLKNVKGRGFELVSSPTLDKKSGIWSSIVSGDLDGDGDDDFILGNLGENHQYTISDTYPMRIYSIDIDQNGTIDPIITSYWRDNSGNMTEFPINAWDELASQSPFFKKKFTSYKEFSFATIDSILDKSTIEAQNTFMVNTTSNYILWNEQGDFRWEKLHSTLQTAPIRKMLVNDLNADGNIDVIIAGNDYSFDPATGYYDASKGFIMLGEGNASFKILKASESGLVLNGQVDGLLYFEGDSSYLVAGINRNKMQVFTRKK